MSVRTRAVLAAVGAALLPLAVLYWWAADELTESSVQRHRRELERQARLVAEALDDRSLSDSLADRLGEEAELRVTFVAADGTVLGDSRVSAERLPELEDHAGRPEVRAALEGRVGWDARASRTVARRLLYVAVPHPVGAVRVALPMEEVERPADRALRTVALVGAGGILVVVLLGGVAERFVTAPFRRLRADAEAVAAGDLSRRHREREGEAEALGRALEKVTNRLEEAEAVRAHAEELTELFDRMDEGLALVDPEGTVLYANRAFREWVGREEAAGRRFETFFRDPEVGTALESALAGRPESRETRLGERTVLVSVRPHSRGAVAKLRDLTRLRRLEGVRRDFVANASHELKTPLTSVLGYAETLTDPDLPGAQVVAFGERILANGIRMRRLIDELLDLSRIESGGWEPEPERMRVEDAARAVWEEIGPGPEEKGLTLDVDAGERASVEADPEGLHQILRNLLDNAVRYAPDGSRVEVTARPEDGRVRVGISDSGPGIPESQQERVFERFYRVDSGRSRGTGGTGLGLSIVKHLVAAHGGEMGIDSRVGEGTTVWFTLPAADAG